MFALLKLIPLRWWIYLAAAAALAGVLWHDDYETHRANAEAAAKRLALDERDQARGTIETMTADLKLSRETSHVLQDRLSKIERDRAAHPLRLRCFVPPAAAMPAQGGSASGADDPAARRVDGSTDLPTFDAGPGLSEFQRRCAVNAAHQVTLQDWEAARSH